MNESDEVGLDDTMASGVRRRPDVSPGPRLTPEAEGRYAGAGEGGTSVELGRGGLGRVLLVVDQHLGREVALKELLPGLKERHGEGFVELEARFVREAQVMARLEHPGVVPVHELVRRADGSLFFTMKRVSGRTLAQALDACASLEERLTLLPHLRELVHTVAFAHAKGVVHRDLKPDNVMVGAFGETLVLDWGLARVKGQADVRPLPQVGPLSVGLTTPGAAMGTPRYMSPEQAAGEVEHLDERSDVWSLGVMLFELLTGRAPFEADSVALLFDAVKNKPLPAVQELEPRAPASLAAVAARALQRAREARFPDASAFAEALDAALLAPLEGRRRRAPWWVAAAVLAALVAGAVGARVLEAPTAGPAAATSDPSAEPLERARAELAQAALERFDVERAAALAAQGHSPRSAGVALLARAAGVPTRAMQLKTEAGCAGLAARGGKLACATFGGVLLVSPQGEELGRLKTERPLWQRAVGFVDGTTVVSTGEDRLVHLWSAATLAHLRALDGLPAEGRALAVVPGGERVVVGAADGEVRLFDLASGASLRLGRHSGPVRAVAVTDTEVASAGDDAVVVRPLEGGEPSVTLARGALALWPRRGGGFTVGTERLVWSLAVQGPAELWAEHQHQVQALVASARHPLISAGKDGALFSWRDGRVAQRLSLEAAPTALAVDPDEPQVDVYVALDDKRVQAWRWPSDARLAAPPEALFEPTAWLPDFESHAALVGQRDGSLRWMGSSRGLAQPLEARHQGPVTALARAGGTLLSAGADGQVLLSREGEAPVVLEPAGASGVLALATDGRRAAWSLSDGTLALWSLEHGAEIARDRASPVRALAFSTDGARLLVGRDDHHLAVLDASTGETLETRPAHDGAVTAVASQGAVVVTAGRDRQVKVWSLAEALPRGTFPVRAEPSVLALTPAGDRLAAGLDDGSVLVWRLPSGTLQLDVPARAGRVRSLALGDQALFVAGTDRLPRWLPLN